MSMMVAVHLEVWLAGCGAATAFSLALPRPS